MEIHHSLGSLAGWFLRTSREFSEIRIKERNWSEIAVLG